MRGIISKLIPCVTATKLTATEVGCTNSQEGVTQSIFSFSRVALMPLFTLSMVPWGFGFLPSMHWLKHDETCFFLHEKNNHTFFSKSVMLSGGQIQHVSYLMC